MMLYLKLYLLFLKIGLLGFGGGYMMIPLFFLEIVGRYKWLSHDDMFNIIAVAQTVPGTLATNTATLVGLNMGHIGFGLVAVLGVVSPALMVAYSGRLVCQNLPEKPRFAGLVEIYSRGSYRHYSRNWTKYDAPGSN